MKSLVIVFIYLVTQIQNVTCLHLTGTWNTGDFYKFLTKFGVQKTDSKRTESTQGFIYGNITSSGNNNKDILPVTFVLVDSEYFKEFYGNRTIALRNKACEVMFKKINHIAYDSECKPNGKEDIIRHIPCPKNKLCIDEDEPQNVIPNFQFTYRIQDPKHPRSVSFIS